MNKSFRLCLALLSALLSGLALTAFGFSTWWLILGNKIDRMDNDVRSGAERETQRTRDVAEWQRTEARMAAETGIRDNRDFLLLVEDGSGAILYRSPDWPANLDVKQFPWLQQSAGSPGPEPSPRPDSDAQGADRRIQPPLPLH